MKEMQRRKRAVIGLSLLCLCFVASLLIYACMGGGPYALQAGQALSCPEPSAAGRGLTNSREGSQNRSPGRGSPGASQMDPSIEEAATAAVVSPPEGPASNSAPAKILVHVSGAVAQPGVYELPPGSAVREALKAAGGLQAEAADWALNQAALVQDHSQIHVLTEEEARTARIQAGSPAAGSNVLPSKSETRPGQELGSQIALNQASLEELCSLPGIGAKTAQDILDFRQARGAFRSLEELMQVPGIKEARFKKLLPYLRL